MRILTLGFLAAAVAMTSVSVSAKTYIRKVVPDRDTCWVVRYEPRTVEDNTMGQLVSKGGTQMIGVVRDGALLRLAQEPDLYDMTTRIVEEEHYYRVKVPCPVRGR